MQKRDSCQKLTEVAIYLLLVFCTMKLAKSQGTEANCYMPMVCENGRIPVWLRMSGEQYSIEKKSPLEEIYAKEITSLHERLEAIQKSVTQIRLQGVRCTAQSNPLKGTVNCSKSNHYGSICNVSCETGYYLSGDEWSECEGEYESGIGSWTSVQATCERVTCLLADEIPGGGYSCTQSNEFNSTCAFRCNDGYYLVGNETITCTDKAVATDGFGTWSDPFPQCAGIKCTPLQSITNGSVSCTATNHFNSSCRFECRKGFFLTGHRDVICGDVDKDGIGDWSEESPSCSGISCATPTVPSHGSIHCPSPIGYNSQCIFSCDSGYTLSGITTMTCEDTHGDGIGKWSHSTPTCLACRGMVHKSICFFAEVHTTYDMELQMAKDICANSGYTMGNIYGENHYNLLVEYIRSIMPKIAYAGIWTGMEADSSKNVLLTNGTKAPFVSWFPNRPLSDSAANRINFRVNRVQKGHFQEKGMYDHYPQWQDYGVLCQR